MFKHFSGFFAAVFVIWILWFATAPEQNVRVERFCSPTSPIVKIGGAFIGIADESMGKNVGNEGGNFVYRACVRNFAPTFLSIFGLYEKSKVTVVLGKEDASLLEKIEAEQSRLRESLVKAEHADTLKNMTAAEVEQIKAVISQKLEALAKQARAIKEKGSKTVDDDFDAEGMSRSDKL